MPPDSGIPIHKPSAAAAGDTGRSCHARSARLRRPPHCPGVDIFIKSTSLPLPPPAPSAAGLAAGWRGGAAKCGRSQPFV